jgi:methionyl-tRNA formyltransferase
VTSGRARTVFVGSGGFGRPVLEHLVDHPDTDLIGVVTAPPRPVGRTQDVAPTPIGAAAAELGIDPILTPERLRDPVAIDAILDLGPELVVLADYGQIVPSDLLAVLHGALNLHPSLLPRHRGATPIPAAILAGDRETGVTLMHMDEGLDTGAIVAQERLDLDGTETTPVLEDRLAVIAADLLGTNLGPWLRGELAARPQPEDGATLTRPLRREDGRLDPGRSVDLLERQIRAFQPWPGSFVDTPIGRLAIWATGIDPTFETSGPPGTFDLDGLIVADGRLLLREVQPASGKRMSWEAFVRGRPGIVGASIRE